MNGALAAALLVLGTPSSGAVVETGVTGHPLTQEGYIQATIPAQLDLVKGLGARWYRCDLPPTVETTGAARFSLLLTEASKRGIRVLPILFPAVDLSKDPVEMIRAEARRHARAVVGRFKGRVRVWELHNELDCFAMIRKGERNGRGEEWKWGDPDGQSGDHYEEGRYARTRAVLLGLAEGVRDADPSAQRVINTGGWLHYGFIRRLIADRVPFEILGWHWYSEMGNMAWAGGVNVVETISAFGKPIWINEFNRRGGHSGASGEDEQASTISSMIRAYRSLARTYPIRAVMAYELLDEPYFGPGNPESHYGLVHLARGADGRWSPDRPHSAFRAVQREFLLMANETPTSPIVSTPEGSARSTELNRAWAVAAFAETAAAAPIMDRLTIVHEDVAGDTHVGRCAAGGPLRLGSKTFKRGIGVNSTSVLRVTLRKPARLFSATIGLDRNVDGTAASVRFKVSSGGADLFVTPVIRPGAAPRAIRVPLSGASEFDLTVDDGGDGRGWDQGDWVDAKVTMEDGTSIWLDDVARSAVVVPALPVSFTYGGRSSRELLGSWRRQLEIEQRPGVSVRTLTLTDPDTALQVRAVASVYTDTPAVDWSLSLHNAGTTDSLHVENIRSVDMTVRPGVASPVRLQRLRGSANGQLSWQPYDEPVQPDTAIRFGSANGRTAGAVGPFFTTDWGTGGLVTAIGWSGQWCAAVERSASGDVRVSAGLPDFSARLRPGESVRLPRILQVHWAGTDRSEGHNAFRRVMLAHVLPRIDGRPVTPPIAHLSTAFYELNATTAESVVSHLRSTDGLGFEVLWLDAYWTRGGFPEGMGNYSLPLSRAEPPDRFPGGLAAVGEAVRKNGMQFLMWFEPERVAPGTVIAKEHPEWVLSPNGDGSGLFNLGDPEARAYMTRYLAEAIRLYGLGWLRFDFNIDPLAYWKFGDRDEPNRRGLTEARYVDGLYRMWDDLRAEFPHLAIDNCASGGQRIDLETCSRSVPLWRTDDTIDPLFRLDFNEAAIRNQIMTAGLGRYVPYSTSGQMGSTPYLFRSGFNAGASFCQDIRDRRYPRAQLKQAIAEGKRLRPYFAGDMHVLSSIDADPTSWCVIQYDRPNQADGMVVAYRRHQSPYGSFHCRLRGIDPTATYHVTTSVDCTRSRPATVSGKSLALIELSIGDMPGSVVIEYRKTMDQKRGARSRSPVAARRPQ